nr:hypothetical protein GCM10025699_75100 [Microbacterium flavescens]
MTPGAPLDLEAWTPVYSGKVRDLYVPAPVAGAVGDAATLADTEHVLVVASDRVSAYDHVLEPGIPGKGPCSRSSACGGSPSSRPCRTTWSTRPPPRCRCPSRSAIARCS